MVGVYSSLTSNTMLEMVNTLGNPVRDPVVSASGDDSTGFVLLSELWLFCSRR